MLPQKEPKSLRLRVDLVAKIVGLLIRDLSLHLAKGNHKELWHSWETSNEFIRSEVRLKKLSFYKFIINKPNGKKEGIVLYLWKISFRCLLNGHRSML